MILIVGSAGSGKRSFVRSLGYTDAQIADAECSSLPVLAHLEQMVFANPDSADRLLPLLLQKEAVLCREVGSGVIPVDDAERAGREATGRLCILLAQQAECVIRMVCGIPTVIKGTLPGRSR